MKPRVTLSSGIFLAFVLAQPGFVLADNQILYPPWGSGGAGNCQPFLFGYCEYDVDYDDFQGSLYEKIGVSIEGAGTAAVEAWFDHNTEYIAPVTGYYTFTLTYEYDVELLVNAIDGAFAGDEFIDTNIYMLFFANVVGGEQNHDYVTLDNNRYDEDGTHKYFRDTEQIVFENVYVPAGAQVFIGARSRADLFAVAVGIAWIEGECWWYLGDLKKIVIDVDNPEEETAVCCVGESCYITTGEECQDMGGAWHPDLDSCDPNPCESPPEDEAVCCVGETCYLTTYDTCEDMGGAWRPDLDSCDPNPCEPPPGDRAVCCAGRNCYLTTLEECDDMGGRWHSNWDSCDPNPCPQDDELRACCTGMSNCRLTTFLECIASLGVWHPFRVTCNPNPCLFGGGGAVNDSMGGGPSQGGHHQGDGMPDRREQFPKGRWNPLDESVETSVEHPGLRTMPSTWDHERNFATIRYSLGHACPVKVVVYDITGRTIATLFDGDQTPGVHTVLWRPEDAPSGIYLYNIKAGALRGKGKLVLVR